MVPGFLNENQYRDYPFQTRNRPLTENGLVGNLTPLPRTAFVDFGLTVLRGVDLAVDLQVRLSSIARASGNLTVTFATAIGGLAPQFVIPENASEFSTVQAEGGADDCDNLLWMAYLVVGNLAELLVQISNNQTVTFNAGLWLPHTSLVQNLSTTHVRSVNLANAARLIVTNPDECPDITQPVAAVVNATCLKGVLTLTNGYNCELIQDNVGNTFVVGSLVGAGRGEPCDEVPLVAGELPQSGSPYLSGGPACDEIITAINGVTGREIPIEGGPGVRVYADPDNAHTLIVELKVDDFLLGEGTSSASL